MTDRSCTVFTESAAELADQLDGMVDRHRCPPRDRRGRPTCPVCALAQVAAASDVPARGRPIPHPRDTVD